MITTFFVFASLPCACHLPPLAIGAALRNLTELHLGANNLTAAAFAANGALVNALCGIQVCCAVPMHRERNSIETQQTFIIDFYPK